MAQMISQPAPVLSLLLVTTHQNLPNLCLFPHNMLTAFQGGAITSD